MTASKNMQQSFSANGQAAELDRCSNTSGLRHSFLCIRPCMYEDHKLQLTMEKLCVSHASSPK
jgi:hypothetical protein